MVPPHPVSLGYDKLQWWQMSKISPFHSISAVSCQRYLHEIIPWCLRFRHLHDGSLPMERIFFSSHPADLIHSRGPVVLATVLAAVPTKPGNCFEISGGDASISSGHVKKSFWVNRLVSCEKIQKSVLVISHNWLYIYIYMNYGKSMKITGFDM